MKTRTAQDIWEAALGELQVQVSRSNYRTWFKGTAGYSYRNGEFSVSVPNAFVAEYLEKNQRSLIEKTLIGHTEETVRVCFRVNGRSGSPKTDDGGGSGIDRPNLNTGYVFDNFVEGNNNRLALAAALAVAANPGQVYNPLFICGGVGLGKTHLLHAIGHAAQGRGIPVVSATAEQFTNDYITAIRERNTPEFRARYRNASVLLIDDVQFINGKQQTEEGFFHIFNELHTAGRQVVLTSDRPPQDMPRLTERLRSRFEWGLIADINQPDYDTRLAILQAKTRLKEANVSVDTLEYIASQIKRNIRELEGCLNRVIAYAKLLRTPPTTDIAARAMENLAARPPRESYTPEALVAAVARALGMSPEDITGPGRAKEVVTGRRLAMYMLRQETGYTLAQIGTLLGGRDAAAVTNATKRVEEELETSPFLQRKAKEIIKYL
ncbi:chromosomal replication initiator protein DnaA, partial [Chloroflexota bacterium]